MYSLSRHNNSTKWSPRSRHPTLGLRAHQTSLTLLAQRCSWRYHKAARNSWYWKCPKTANYAIDIHSRAVNTPSILCLRHLFWKIELTFAHSLDTRGYIKRSLLSFFTFPFWHNISHAQKVRALFLYFLVCFVPCTGWCSPPNQKVQRAHRHIPVYSQNIPHFHPKS